MHMWYQEVYEISLYRPLNAAVNLKLPSEYRNVYRLEVQVLETDDPGSNTNFTT